MGTSWSDSTKCTQNSSQGTTGSFSQKKTITTNKINETIVSRDAKDIKENNMEQDLIDKKKQLEDTLHHVTLTQEQISKDANDMKQGNKESLEEKQEQLLKSTNDSDQDTKEQIQLHNNKLFEEKPSAMLVQEKVSKATTSEDIIENFIFEDKSKDEITKIDKEREIMLGIYKQPGWGSHWYLMAIYPAFVKNGITFRIYSIELMLDNGSKKNILRVSGPAYYRGKDYKCEKYYITKTTIMNIVNIAIETMNNHGKYNYFLNNCQDFATNVMSKVQDVTKTLGVDFTNDMMDTYIKKYPQRQDTSVHNGYCSFTDLITHYPL